MSKIDRYDKHGHWIGWSEKDGDLEKHYTESGHRTGWSKRDGDTEKHYDKDGHWTGWSKRDEDTEKHYDKNGRSTGWSKQDRNTEKHYNKNGHWTGWSKSDEKKDAQYNESDQNEKAQKTWSWDDYGYEKDESESSVSVSSSSSSGGEIAGFMVLVFIFSLLGGLYIISKNSTQSSPNWVYEESQIPKDEYGSLIKSLNGYQGVNVRKDADVNSDWLGYIRSGSYVRVKDFNDLKWGFTGKRRTLWLKIYDKNSKTGYIVYDFIDQQSIPATIKPHRKHNEYPNVIESNKEGIWAPAPGYKWVSKSEDDFRVVWSSGEEHSDYPHVIASNKEGIWNTAPGYKWISESEDDLRVVWSPEEKHSKHPNVIASHDEGSWKPAQGYVWVNKNDSNDFRVKPK